MNLSDYCSYKGFLRKAYHIKRFSTWRCNNVTKPSDIYIYFFIIISHTYIKNKRIRNTQRTYRTEMKLEKSEQYYIQAIISQ